jgi:recombination protein RecA
MNEIERAVQLKHIHAIADTIRKGREDDSAIMLFDSDAVFDVNVISSGSILLDEALGVGGFPRGRITELFGEEGGGKTSIALSTVAQAQMMGLICAYIDSENSLDLGNARALGVDMELLLVSQLNCTEDVFDMVSDLLANDVRLIVIDSIAGTAPRAELESGIGDLQIGLNARLIGQAMRDLAKKVKGADATLILINQLRDKIGVFFGNKETTPGGRSIKFYSTVRLDVRGRGYIKKGEEVVGIRILAYVAKNKVAAPFRKTYMDFFFAKGFDNELALFDLAVEKGLISRKGKSGYYVWDTDGTVSKLRKDWGEYLKENPDKLKILIDEVKTSA